MVKVKIKNWIERVKKEINLFFVEIPLSLLIVEETKNDLLLSYFLLICQQWYNTSTVLQATTAYGTIFVANLTFSPFHKGP